MRVGAAVLACVVVGATLAISVAGPATAAPTERFNRAWGSFGTGPGQFEFPRGMAVDAAGRVYVADMVNDRIQVFDRNGVFVDAFGSFGTGNGQFKNPRDVAIDNNENLFVADTGNHRIQVLSPTGSFIRKWGSLGSANAQFTAPSGIDVFGNQVFVADTGNRRIQRFSSNTGAFQTAWGSSGFDDGEFTSPTDVVVNDVSQRVFVTDAGGNNRVQRFRTDGTFEAKWGSSGSGNGQFHNPSAVAIDPASAEVLVADATDDRIQRFTPDGGFLESVGTSGTGNGQFDGPAGVVADGLGNVFVADTNHHRVERFGFVTPGGPPFVRTWGSQGAGPGQFQESGDVAVDTQGNIYVVDSFLDRIQKFDPNGTLLLTIANRPFLGAVAVDASGNIYASEAGNLITKFSPDGAVATQWASVASGMTVSPSTGNVIVTTGFLNKVVVFTPTGSVVREFGTSGASCQGRVTQPSAITADQIGGVYVVDTFDCIQRFSEAGNFVDSWSSTGTAPGQLTSPTGLAVDRTGHILVGDSATDTVQEFNLSGDLLARWGNTGLPGSFGRLSDPSGVAADAFGNVYVAESSGDRVERFARPSALGGTVTGPSGPVGPVLVVAVQGGRIVRAAVTVGGGFNLPVPPGRYAVGYLPLAGTHVVEWLIDRPTLETADLQTVFPVQPGQFFPANATLSAAPAPPPGAATVTGTVSGPNGPVAGAAVLAVDPATNRIKGATTNASGTYTISGIPPGSNYRIQFIDPTVALLAEWHNDVPFTDPASATVLNLADGSTTTINAFLSDDPGV